MWRRSEWRGESVCWDFEAEGEEACTRMLSYLERLLVCFNNSMIPTHEIENCPTHTDTSR